MRPALILPLFLLAVLLPACAGDAPSVPGNSPRTAAPAARNPDPRTLEGAWEGTGESGRYVRFEGSTFTFVENGRIAEGRILNYIPGAMVIRLFGIRQIMDVAVRGDTLTMKPRKADYAGAPQTYRRRRDIPPELALAPAPIARARTIPPARKAALQRELARRESEDRAAHAPGARPEDTPRVVADNGDWLRKTVAEIGWIDAARFDLNASFSAALIAEHTSDLPLMLAILPEIEMDMKMGSKVATPYASLYDRIRLMRGDQQKYGSQILRNSAGEMLILPLENRATADDDRKAIGLPPFAKHLEALKRFNNGRDVQVLEEK
ncbi:MAG: DUF6624 domain-containing protein [Planctomycetota bacterium]